MARNSSSGWNQVDFDGRAAIYGIGTANSIFDTAMKRIGGIGDAYREADQANALIERDKRSLQLANTLRGVDSVDQAKAGIAGIDANGWYDTKMVDDASRYSLDRGTNLTTNLNTSRHAGEIMSATDTAGLTNALNSMQTSGAYVNTDALTRTGSAQQKLFEDQAQRKQTAQDAAAGRAIQQGQLSLQQDQQLWNQNKDRIAAEVGLINSDITALTNQLAYTNDRAEQDQINTQIALKKDLANSVQAKYLLQQGVPTSTSQAQGQGQGVSYLTQEGQPQTKKPVEATSSNVVPTTTSVASQTAPVDLQPQPVIDTTVASAPVTSKDSRGSTVNSILGLDASTNEAAITQADLDSLNALPNRVISQQAPAQAPAQAPITGIERIRPLSFNSTNYKPLSDTEVYANRATAQQKVQQQQQAVDKRNQEVYQGLAPDLSKVKENTERELINRRMDAHGGLVTEAATSTSKFNDAMIASLTTIRGKAGGFAAQVVGGQDPGNAVAKAFEQDLIAATIPSSKNYDGGTALSSRLAAYEKAGKITPERTKTLKEEAMSMGAQLAKFEATAVSDKNTVKDSQKDIDETNLTPTRKARLTEELLALGNEVADKVENNVRGLGLWNSAWSANAADVGKGVGKAVTFFGSPEAGTEGPLVKQLMKLGGKAGASDKGGDLYDLGQNSTRLAASLVNTLKPYIETAGTPEATQRYQNLIKVQAELAEQVKQGKSTFGSQDANSVIDFWKTLNETLEYIETTKKVVTPTPKGK